MLKVNVTAINIAPIEDILKPTPGIIAYPDPIVMAIGQPLAGYRVP